MKVEDFEKFKNGDRIAVTIEGVVVDRYGSMYLTDGASNFTFFPLSSEFAANAIQSVVKIGPTEPKGQGAVIVARYTGGFDKFHFMRTENGWVDDEGDFATWNDLEVERIVFEGEK